MTGFACGKLDPTIAIRRMTHRVCSLLDKRRLLVCFKCNVGSPMYSATNRTPSYWPELVHRLRIARGVLCVQELSHTSTRPRHEAYRVIANMTKPASNLVEELYQTEFDCNVGLQKAQSSALVFFAQNFKV